MRIRNSVILSSVGRDDDDGAEGVFSAPAQATKTEIEQITTTENVPRLVHRFRDDELYIKKSLKQTLEEKACKQLGFSKAESQQLVDQESVLEFNKKIKT